MADMGVFQALHTPEIGILCAGGHFTMDMKRAAYAAKTFFDFKTVIPCHYRTFPAAGAVGGGAQGGAAGRQRDRARGDGGHRHLITLPCEGPFTPKLSQGLPLGAGHPTGA